MSLSIIIALTLVCAVTYVFEITFGLAGTILMLMVMSSFVDTKVLVIYSVLPQILVATIGLYRSPKTVNIRFLGGMLIYATIGSVLGLYLFYYFSTEVFRLLLAVAITLFGAYLVIAARSFQIRQSVQRALDTLAGASQAMFGISGPIAMTRLLGSFDNKLVIRNYALAFFLSLNLIRAGTYYANDTVTDDIVRAMLISGPVLVVVLWYSNRLHMHVNEALFRRVVAWMILIGGVSLLLRDQVS